MRNTTLEQVRSTVSRAIAEQDAAVLRQALRLGATFASFTIRQRTEAAEANFVAWREAGCPADVRDAGILFLWQAKNARLAALDALSDAEILTLYALPEHVAPMYFADRVPGYGPESAHGQWSQWLADYARGAGHFCLLDALEAVTA